MSWWLARAGVDHVVLERGVVGQSWRERPLALAAPAHPELDEPPAGAATTSAATRTTTWARPRWSVSSTATPAPSAPRSSRTRRSSACGRRPRGSAWTPTAARGGAGPSSWRRAPRARRGSPRSPAELGGDLQQVTALGYREPGQVAPGAVLVVGASASGVQIADELRRAGRSVTLAVGDHVRVPRTYRGRDIYRWLDELGVLDERYDEVEDLVRARRLPSLQLVGTPQRRSLDLATLSASGGPAHRAARRDRPAAAPCSRARWRTSSRRATSSRPGCWTASTSTSRARAESTGRTRRRCPRR